MVVVLPAPLGPSRPKALAQADLQVEPANGLDVAFVGFEQIAAANRHIHEGMIT